MNQTNEVLLVEDNPYDVELMSIGFKKHKLGGELIVARDGEEALDYLYRQGKFQRRLQGNPSLILLDVRMPRVNGIEVLHQIKNDDDLKDIPVIVLTAYPEVKSIINETDVSVAFMEKPVNFEKLQANMKKIVRPKATGKRELSVDRRRTHPTTEERVGELP
jgi:CheY-like chemotaxis protein